MKTEILQIEKLLIQVHNMSAYYEKFAEQTGENFNIFETLGLASSEVRLHSKILAEFLNPKGTHGQKNVFLELFVKMFDIKDFDTESAYAEVEKYIGVIDKDYTKGGRIDIIIADKNNNHIIIENKIYAIDQTNQLLRYYNFDRKAKIFYLSLYDNQSPDPSSLGGVLAIEKIKIISYRTHIIQWLEECKKVSTSLPIICETIAQYINLLKILTNQTTYNKMNDEIIELIKENPNYADSIVKCNSALKTIIDETYVKFNNELDFIFPQKTLLVEDGNYQIISNRGEDSDGIFFCFQLLDNGVNLCKSNVANKYKDIFERIDSSFHKNDWNICWYNPRPFNRCEKFDSLDLKLIVGMYSNEEVLKAFVRELVDAHNEISKKFLAELEKENGTNRERNY